MGQFTMDMRTLDVLTTVICFLYAIAAFFYGRSQKGFKGFDWLAFSFLTLSVGFMLLGHQQIWPDFWTMFVANTLFSLGMVFFYEAIRRFCFDGKPWGKGWLPWGALVIGTFVFAYNLYVEPSMTGRIVTVSLIHFVFDLMVVWVLLSDLSVSWKMPRIVTSGVVLIDAIYALVRVFFTLRSEPLTQLLLGGNFHSIVFITTIVLITGTTFGLIWMVSERLEMRLVEMAMQDPLTGLLNRRGVEMMVQQEFAKFGRLEEFEMSVMMLDIDFFKNINDVYGHSAGDQVLVAFAHELRKCLRNYDILGRIGGEEFIIFLPNTNLNNAIMIAERIRAHIEEHVFKVGLALIKFTTSIGVSDFIPENATLDSVIPFADQALFQSKQEGRNQVSVFGVENFSYI
jgi:diguanylate cyclase (GGDEF)-like protein